MGPRRSTLKRLSSDVIVYSVTTHPEINAELSSSDFQTPTKPTKTHCVCSLHDCDVKNSVKSAFVHKAVVVGGGASGPGSSTQLR